MKRLILLYLLLLAASCVVAQNENKPVHIIPQPVSVSVQQGHFVFNPETNILFDDSASEDIAKFLTRKLNNSMGFSYIAEAEDHLHSNSLLLRLKPVYDTVLGEEGYTLKVTPQNIVISANRPHGLFYGIQSLFQLMPPQIENDTVHTGYSWTAPCVDIIDYPKFHWRGLMLDVSRHFFTAKEVKEYIDEMAKYKYNVFHWHLTDDQGWRIEIKGLPKLTKAGAWRVPRTGKWGSFQAPERGEKTSYGGYYTQEEIRDIIRYAQKRFITVLPEIDVPGHSLALIASYPSLSCAKKQYPVAPQYAPAKYDNVLCVASDSTWLILDKIFTQIAELFPSEYIHVGGDEANRKFWTKDPKDIALMKKAGIKTPAGLQSYFEKRLEKLILAKGKKMIGWDEIIEGGLAPEATVMSWRGMKGGVRATQMGHHVVMSPYGKTYLSQLQGDPLAEPAGPGMTTLKECYFTSILPKGVNPEMVLGGEACLWTEYIPNFRHAEYMTWPRALALSEVFWGTKSNWGDFTRRVIAQLPYLDAAQVKYAPSMFDPRVAVRKINEELKIVLSTEIPGLDLYFAFDGTNPDKYYPKYKGTPLAIPKGASQIRVITYKEGKPVGRQINYPIKVLKQRMK